MKQAGLKYVLNRLDAKARASGQTRSGYIARLAVEARV
jgi:hypothetical protein